MTKKITPCHFACACGTGAGDERSEEKSWVQQEKDFSLSLEMTMIKMGWGSL